MPGRVYDRVVQPLMRRVEDATEEHVKPRGAVLLAR
jgi:hypothetical protein